MRRGWGNPWSAFRNLSFQRKLESLRISKSFRFCRNDIIFAEMPAWGTKYPHPSPLPEGEGTQLAFAAQKKIRIGFIAFPGFINFCRRQSLCPLSLWERARVRVLSVFHSLRLPKYPRLPTPLLSRQPSPSSRGEVKMAVSGILV